MKRFCILCLALILCFGITGCAKQAAEEPTDPPKPVLNPDLVECLGDLIDEDAEAGIHQLMKELQDAYDSYSQGGEFMTFGEAVDDTLTEYESFLDELRDELFYMIEEETDKDRKELATQLSIQVSYCLLTFCSWDSYVFEIQMGNIPSHSADEVEQDIFETINGLSQLFYATDICPIV